MRCLLRSTIAAIPPSARQLREYGANVRAVAFKFTVGRRGRPRAGDEAKIFTADEIGRQRLAEFLLSGDYARTPRIQVALVGETHEAQIERVFEKIMVVLKGTEEVVFAAQPQAI